VKSPVRWLDAGADAPPGARELLREAPPAPPFTDELRHRLGAGVANVGALPATSGWPALLLKGVVVAGIGAARGLAAHSWAGSHDPPPAPVVAVSAVAVAPAAAPSLAASAVPVEALPLLQLPAPTPEPPRLKLDPRLEEAELLEKARGLVGSNPAAALKLTAEHARDYPKGRLGAEADLIAAQSLLALGNVSAAKARAKASLARYPRGLYARQLREIVER
jgi:hypothetical protein